MARGGVLDLVRPDIFWVCPICEALNKWEDSRCKECHHTTDLLFSLTTSEADSPGFIVPVLWNRIRVVHTQRNTYVRAAPVYISPWWNTLRELSEIARMRHAPMNVIMKQYKGLKNTGLNDTEIVARMLE